MSYTLKFTLYGTGFGLCFPICATILDVLLSGNTLSIHTLVHSQLSNPLLWMIDTAPLFLGAFAYFGGTQFQKLMASRAQEKNLYDLLQIKNKELENKVKERTKQLETNIEKLVEANQLRTEFIATVSHELRTPLTAISGAIKLIKSAAVGSIDEQGMSLITLADKNTTLLSCLVDDLLDIEKIEAGKLQFEFNNFPLNSLIENAVSMSQPYAESFNVKIKTEGIDTTIEISTDKRRFIQILLNLISNSCKFSSAGEEVIISVDKNEKTFRINVADTGEGIPKAFEKSIFEKFTQADSSSNRSRNGTGLGLSICKGLTESLGGTIGFHPNGDKGTVFFIEFACAPS